MQAIISYHSIYHDIVSITSDALAKYNILFGNQIFHALRLQMIQISSFSISSGHCTGKRGKKFNQIGSTLLFVVRASFSYLFHAIGRGAFHLKPL